MNAPAIIPTETLPALIDRAMHALESARSSAEVLEARDMARVAYDAAKSAGRMARAKGAHDDMLGVVYRMQADASFIEARAKVRLADEYDAAQARGEVAGHGRSKVEADNLTTAADLGLRRDQIHEARQIRDAERESPGLIRRALDQMVRPEPTAENPNPRPIEPTRAALGRSVMDAISANQKRPTNKNPTHVKDAQRDAVIGFAGDCRRIAETVAITDLARWRGTPSMARQAREQAGAAIRALTIFIDEWDTQDAQE